MTTGFRIPREDFQRLIINRIKQDMETHAGYWATVLCEYILDIPGLDDENKTYGEAHYDTDTDEIVIMPNDFGEVPKGLDRHFTQAEINHYNIKQIIGVKR
ncbi:MAG: hypothetical protein ACM3QX_18355 [Syntrophomonadaceae bacterium]